MRLQKLLCRLRALHSGGFDLDASNQIVKEYHARGERRNNNQRAIGPDLPLVHFAWVLGLVLFESFWQGSGLRATEKTGTSLSFQFFRVVCWVTLVVHGAMPQVLATELPIPRPPGRTCGSRTFWPTALRWPPCARDSFSRAWAENAPAAREAALKWAAPYEPLVHNPGR